MKKVSKRKMNKAETAETLGTFWNGLYNEDFCVEMLLKLSKVGEKIYVLIGRGGAATKYAEISGNNASEGCDIRDLTPEEAKEWLLKNHKQFEKEFPDLIEEA